MSRYLTVAKKYSLSGEDASATEELQYGGDRTAVFDVNAWSSERGELLMEIPTQLKNTLITLSSEESEELEQIITSFPAIDKELADLIGENLDALVAALTAQEDN